MNSLAHTVQKALAAWSTAPVCWVAYSGGLDSTVLLHVLAHVRQHQKLPPLYAVHIQHDLQAVAQQWPEHCRRFAQSLEVPLRMIAVHVPSGAASIEQAARIARYAAWVKLLQPGALLCLAQHREDQAETLLFRLLRGAGVRGLAAMPPVRKLGAGRLLRPLLDVPRAELLAYAKQHQLSWVEDPSNTDLQYTRNYLRHQVVPLLAERWPAVCTVLARTATHFSEAQQLLEDLAATDIAAAQTDVGLPWLGLPRLNLQALRQLSEARQKNALRAFLAPLTPLPDEAHWAGWRSLRDAAVDAKPIWQLAGGHICREGNTLWWLSGDWCTAIVPEQRLALLELRLELPNNGVLHLEGLLPTHTVLEIGYRTGGERCCIAARGRHTLKNLLQEAGIPSFVRTRLPLLYLDGQVVAVANLPMLSHPSGWRLIWQPPESGGGGLS